MGRKICWLDRKKFQGKCYADGKAFTLLSISLQIDKCLLMRYCAETTSLALIHFLLLTSTMILRGKCCLVPPLTEKAQAPRVGAHGRLPPCPCPPLQAALFTPLLLTLWVLLPVTFHFLLCIMILPTYGSPELPPHVILQIPAKQDFPIQSPQFSVHFLGKHPSNTPLT